VNEPGPTRPRSPRGRAPPSRVAQESVHRDHEALEWVIAHVAQVLTDQTSPSRSATPPRVSRSLGEDAAYASVAINAIMRRGGPDERHAQERSPSLSRPRPRKIHLEILSGRAPPANDHVLCPRASTTEYIEEDAGDDGASFTEGLGAVIASTRPVAPWDVVPLRQGRARSSSPLRRAGPSLPAGLRLRHQGPLGWQAAGVRSAVESQRLIRPSSKVLLVEDLVSTGSTLIS